MLSAFISAPGAWLPRMRPLLEKKGGIKLGRINDPWLQNDTPNKPLGPHVQADVYLCLPKPQ